MSAVLTSQKTAVLLLLSGLGTRMEQETCTGAAYLLCSIVTSRVQRIARVETEEGSLLNILQDLGTETPDGLWRNIAGLPLPSLEVSIFHYFGRIAGERNASAQQTG